VAAALAVEAGHEVVGATLKLWGGDSDSGCCSVSDVDDARRVADQLGIDHHVFNFTEAFDQTVVQPYVDGHLRGATPNPCIECNRHVKFGVLLDRTRRLGFDVLVTGHHARVVTWAGLPRLRRGQDAAKDQSYVLAMLVSDQLHQVLLPVGDLTKAEVRAVARRRGLRTAAKPDSQDVCFIRSDQGRELFIGERATLHAGDLVDADSGQVVGRVPAVELVTVGQRRGLADGQGGARRYAVAVDVANRRVTVGSARQASVSSLKVDHLTWFDGKIPGRARVLVQTSAHGPVRPATLQSQLVEFDEPQRPVAGGQTTAFFDPEHPELVLGSAVVDSERA